MVLYMQHFFIAIMEVLCYKIFFETFSEKRNDRNRVLSTITFIIMIFLVCSLENFFQKQLLLKSIVIIIVTASIMYFLYPIKFMKNIVISASFQSLLVVIDYLTLLIAMGFWKNKIEIEQKYILEGILTIVLGKSVLFLWIILIKKIIGKRKIILLNQEAWLNMLFCSLFSICSVLVMTNILDELENQKIRAIGIIVALGLIGINIVVFYLINNILVKEEKIRENELLKVQISTRIELYNSISENFEKQRKKIHEYRNQILCIDALVSSKNYQKLEEYMGSICSGLNRGLYVINTNNVLIDAILNVKYQEAMDKNILFVIKINDLSEVRISDEDIVVILSNLLNNAIEACEQCNEKIIKLKFVKEAEGIIISVKNTFCGKLSFRNGELITTKIEDIDEHGVGIKNIIDTVEKYNGSFVIKNNEKEFYFSIYIPN